MRAERAASVCQVGSATARAYSTVISATDVVGATGCATIGSVLGVLRRRPLTEFVPYLVAFAVLTIATAR